MYRETDSGLAVPKMLRHAYGLDLIAALLIFVWYLHFQKPQKYPTIFQFEFLLNKILAVNIGVE